MTNIYIPLVCAKDKDNLRADEILLKKNTKYLLKYEYCLDKIIPIHTGDKDRSAFWLANKIANGYYNNIDDMDMHHPEDLTLVSIKIDEKTKVIQFDCDS